MSDKVYYSNEDLIGDLKYLISEWEEEIQKVVDMHQDWEENDDPASDPGLQYEQEMIAEGKFNDICDFAKKYLSNNNN